MIRKPPIRYFVENVEGQWLVRRDHKLHGPYEDRAAAIRQAIEAGHTSGRNDRPSQVLVQAEDGTFRAEWTYGDDAYPPPG